VAPQTQTIMHTSCCSGETCTQTGYLYHLTCSPRGSTRGASRAASVRRVKRNCKAQEVISYDSTAPCSCAGCGRALQLAVASMADLCLCASGCCSFLPAPVAWQLMYPPGCPHRCRTGRSTGLQGGGKTGGQQTHSRLPVSEPAASDKQGFLSSATQGAACIRST
jgi:hypothetical protein